MRVLAGMGDGVMTAVGDPRTIGVVCGVAVLRARNISRATPLFLRKLVKA